MEGETPSVGNRFMLALYFQGVELVFPYIRARANQLQPDRFSAGQAVYPSFFTDRGMGHERT